jgi:hypothetical protein
MFLPLIALAAAACGQAFSTASGDGGAPGSDDASFDTGAPGEDAAGGEDAGGEDGARPRDATMEDAPSRDANGKEGGGKGDGSTIDLDSGPIVDAGSCARTCPAGFECIVDKCLDRAAPHFSATNNAPFNWSYGYATDLNGSFHAYASHWSPNSSIDVWSTAPSSLEPSVFHNGALLPQMYAEMTIPGGALGLYAGGTGQESIVRWIAPAAGTYAINATFVGISAPVTTVYVGVFVNSTVGPGTSQSLNAYPGDGNTFTFSPQPQALAAGSVVDFYVIEITNLDDPPGGVSLDAVITAQ